MGPGGIFPTNPNLADILGRTDLDFENFHFGYFGFQIPKFPNPPISKTFELGMRGTARLGLGLAGPGLGKGWAGPGVQSASAL